MNLFFGVFFVFVHAQTKNNDLLKLNHLWGKMSRYPTRKVPHLQLEPLSNDLDTPLFRDLQYIQCPLKKCKFTKNHQKREIELVEHQLHIKNENNTLLCRLSGHGDHSCRDQNNLYKLVGTSEGEWSITVEKYRSDQIIKDYVPGNKTCCIQNSVRCKACDQERTLASFCDEKRRKKLFFLGCCHQEDLTNCTEEFVPPPDVDDEDPAETELYKQAKRVQQGHLSPQKMKLYLKNSFLSIQTRLNARPERSIAQRKFRFKNQLRKILKGSPIVLPKEMFTWKRKEEAQEVMVLGNVNETEITVVGPHNKLWCGGVEKCRFRLKKQRFLLNLLTHLNETYGITLLHQGQNLTLTQNGVREGFLSSFRFTLEALGSAVMGVTEVNHCPTPLLYVFKCKDGTFCNSLSSCCKGGIARCPRNKPYKCSNCTETSCCQENNSTCDVLPTTNCTEDPTPVENENCSCPTFEDNLLGCKDNSTCRGLNCCRFRGGLQRCPKNKPIMCQIFQQCSEDYCCVEKTTDCPIGPFNCTGACPEEPNACFVATDYYISPPGQNCTDNHLIPFTEENCRLLAASFNQTFLEQTYGPKPKTCYKWKEGWYLNIDEDYGLLYPRKNDSIPCLKSTSHSPTSLPTYHPAALKSYDFEWKFRYIGKVKDFLTPERLNLLSKSILDHLPNAMGVKILEFDHDRLKITVNGIEFKKEEFTIEKIDQILFEVLGEGVSELEEIKLFDYVNLYITTGGVLLMLLLLVCVAYCRRTPETTLASASKAVFIPIFPRLSHPKNP